VEIDKERNELIVGRDEFRLLIIGWKSCWGLEIG
jgi:hypothetical protein